ncbi:hypothetical protein [Chryseobacterium sp.]|uniref:hypothetical protein n=1 Tax=Chryseobacterium sp. TaxID=1871047 RepID=UPI002FC8A2D1
MTEGIIVNSENSFGAFRYFIIPSEQTSLFDTVDEKRGIAIQSFFSVLLTDKKRSFEIKGKKHLLVFKQKITESVYVCKFSMEAIKTIHKEGESDIENISETDYPFIWVIIDISRQILFIELKTTVFSSISVAKERLKNFLELGFDLYGFEVAIEEISDSSTFWKFVDESEGVYEVLLILNSPNLFGGYNNTNDMLKDIQGTYNNSKTVLKLSNAKPKLQNISPNNTKLKDAVDYASAGGGEWAVTVKPKGLKKRTHKSKHTIKKLSFKNIDSTEYLEQLKKDIINSLNKVETILRNKGE